MLVVHAGNKYNILCVMMFEKVYVGEEINLYMYFIERLNIFI